MMYRMILAETASRWATLFRSVVCAVSPSLLFSEVNKLKEMNFLSLVTVSWVKNISTLSVKWCSTPLTTNIKLCTRYVRSWGMMERLIKQAHHLIVSHRSSTENSWHFASSTVPEMGRDSIMQCQRCLCWLKQSWESAELMLSINTFSDRSWA